MPSGTRRAFAPAVFLAGLACLAPAIFAQSRVPAAGAAGYHQMIMLDANSGALLAALPIGKGVDATASNPGTGLAFASNGEGTLTVARENPGVDSTSSRT